MQAFYQAELQPAIQFGERESASNAGECKPKSPGFSKTAAKIIVTVEASSSENRMRPQSRFG